MKMLNSIKFSLLSVALVAAASYSKAQLSPLGTMYFQNQYVNNPAYAGTDKDLRLDAGVRLQDSRMPGSPKIQFITATYALSDKAGLGFNLNAEQIGLIKKVRSVATYAYHLPLNTEDKLSFGLSLGFTDQVVDYNMIDGQTNDGTLGNFNQRDTYVDGDFGIRYKHKQFTLEGAIPNLSNFYRDKTKTGSVSNLARYYAAASYQYDLSGTNGTILEPKLAFRAVDGFKDIFDLGLNVRFIDDKLNIFGLYHTSQSATLGIAAKLTANMSMNFMYTSATAVLAGESSGSYEINLRLDLFKRKNKN